MNQGNDVTPWYRQFWPWFIIALPATIVVACIGMLVVAIRHDDSVVHDNYYKEGLAINLRLAEDEAAARLGMAGRLRLDLASGDANLLLTSDDGPLPAVLQLLFTHPLSADRDFAIELRQIAGDSYRGDLAESIQGRWHLELRSDQGESWRLRKTVDIDPARETPQHWELMHE